MIVGLLFILLQYLPPVKGTDCVYAWIGWVFVVIGILLYALDRERE